VITRFGASLMQPASGVLNSKHGLTGCQLVSAEHRALAHGLRYRVFVDGLKWVGGEDGLEVDEHDESAIVFGVLEGHLLRGTVRVILPHHPFMLEHAFRDLLDGQPLRKTADVIEVSRFAIDPDMADRRQKRRVVFLLHYLLYLWMRRNRMRYLYMVSTHAMIESLRRTRGTTITTFGRKAVMRDNSSYQAALIDMGPIMDWRHRVQYRLQFLLL
jgi:N-acyl-L-homoserine lactone synthetase